MEWYVDVSSFTSAVVDTFQMTATGIVALFSALSAASAGAHGSVGGLLSMLSAMRSANPSLFKFSPI